MEIYMKDRKLEVSEKLGTALVKMGKATLRNKVMRAEEPKAEKPKKKRAYKRRDMQAEEE